MRSKSKCRQAFCLKTVSGASDQTNAFREFGKRNNFMRDAQWRRVRREGDGYVCVADTRLFGPSLTVLFIFKCVWRERWRHSGARVRPSSEKITWQPIGGESTEHWLKPLSAGSEWKRLSAKTPSTNRCVLNCSDNSKDFSEEPWLTVSLHGQCCRSSECAGPSSDPQY